MLLLDLNNCSRPDLEHIGIRFSSDVEAKAFLDGFIVEYEVRIGEAISKRATQDQLAEFDMCLTQKEADAWLEKYCPDYRSIIVNVHEDMEVELVVCRYLIPGASAKGINMSGVSVSTLDFSYAVLKRLAQNNIHNLGELVSCKGYTEIQGIDEHEINEIRRKLALYVISTICREQGWRCHIRENGSIHYDTFVRKMDCQPTGFPWYSAHYPHKDITEEDEENEPVFEDNEEEFDDYGTF